MKAEGYCDCLLWGDPGRSFRKVWCVWRLPNLSAPFRGRVVCISMLKGHLRQRLSQLNPGLLLGMQRDGRGEQKQLGGPLGLRAEGDGP